MTRLGTFDRTAKHSTARPSHITSVYSFLVAHHLLLLLLFDWSVPLVGHHHRWGCKKQQQRFWQVQQYLCPLCRCWRVFVLLLSRCQVIANCVLLTISAILSSKEKTLGRICCSWALWVSLIQVCFQEYHEEVQRGGKYCTAYRVIGWVGLQVIERVVVTRFAAATFSSHAYWMMMFLFRQTHLILLIGYGTVLFLSKAVSTPSSFVLQTGKGHTTSRARSLLQVSISIWGLSSEELRIKSKRRMSFLISFQMELRAITPPPSYNQLEKFCTRANTDCYHGNIDAPLHHCLCCLHCPDGI